VQDTRLLITTGDYLKAHNAEYISWTSCKIQTTE